MSFRFWGCLAAQGFDSRSIPTSTAGLLTEKGREQEPPGWWISARPGVPQIFWVTPLVSWLRFNEIAAEVQPSLFSPIEYPVDLDHSLLQVVDGAGEREPIAAAYLTNLVVGLAF
jgi:hypothetical protein